MHGASERRRVACESSVPSATRTKKLAAASGVPSREAPATAGSHGTHGAASAATVADTIWVRDASGHRKAVRLSKFRSLILDSAYRPLGLVTWQRAMTLGWRSNVEVLEVYPGVSIASARAQHALPAVIRCVCYVHKIGRMRVPLTRKNILLRDNCTCQYCGSRSELSVDHVTPVSRGGATTWTNCVTACRICNQLKGDKSLAQLGWRPRRQPKEPTVADMAGRRAITPLGEGHTLPGDVWDTYVAPWLQGAPPQERAACMPPTRGSA